MQHQSITFMKNSITCFPVSCGTHSKLHFQLSQTLLSTLKKPKKAKNNKTTTLSIRDNLTGCQNQKSISTAMGGRRVNQETNERLLRNRHKSMAEFQLKITTKVKFKMLVWARGGRPRSAVPSRP